MSIEMDTLPCNMNVSVVTSRYWAETNKYSYKEPYSDEYGLEIFHQAIVEHDTQAWELLIERFHKMVLSWLRRHPNREIAYRLNSEENYIALAFERFWMGTLRNQKIEFHSVAAALNFLRACLNSVIIDTLRGQMREMPFPETGFDEPAVENLDDGLELWNAIKSLIPGEREQRLAYLLYHCGLKPRQIVHYCPEEFNDVQEIFRMTRNILDRLRRNKDRLRWLLSDVAC